MHELSVMRSIVETLTDHVGAEGGSVTTLRLDVGRLSGVSPHALRFCFPLATAGTVLEGAELVVTETPGRELLIDSIEVI